MEGIDQIPPCVSPRNDTLEGGDESDDEIFSRLEKEIEDDFDMAAFRERRLEEMKREMNALNDMRERGHGRLEELVDEKEVIRVSASEKRCVIHFYHRDFKRCEIMNRHLEILASKHFETRFLKVFVESVPWLVERLQIKVLPCVICFIDGVAKHRLIGFEEVGNSDEFETAALELRLQMTGVINEPNTSTGSLQTRDGTSLSKIRGRQDDESSDSD